MKSPLNLGTMYKLFVRSTHELLQIVALYVTVADLFGLL